jgi:uncharacterized OB-fold protein
MARPLPELSQDVAFFWESGADGILRMLQCSDCEYWIHPPGPLCPICFSREIAPQPLSGRAVVATFTINRHQWNPSVEVPYNIAIVELIEQEGLRLTTNIVGCDIDDLYVDMPVQVEFESIEDLWLPVFRPVDAS